MVSQATRTCAGSMPFGKRLAIEEIDHLVGDAVADLVRMTFGNRFAGEKIVLARHSIDLALRSSRRQAGEPNRDRIPAAARSRGLLAGWALEVKGQGLRNPSWNRRPRGQCLRMSLRLSGSVVSLNMRASCTPSGDCSAPEIRSAPSCVSAKPSSRFSGCSSS